MLLPDHTFLISGGASGLGAACARRFVSAGAKVLIADIDPAGQRLADDLGRRCAFHQTDVTCENSIQEALELARNRLGPLRGAVLCAGILRAEKVLTSEGVSSLASFRQVVEVNLVGTFNVLRLAANEIQKQPPEDDGERGVIVTTSSVSAFEGQIGQAAYSASKAGVAGLTLPIARELARFGIRLMSIAPGVFETPMMRNVPDKVRDSLLAQVPFPPRFGNPDEFAALAQHIIENRMLNGEVIRLDGATRLQAR